MVVVNLSAYSNQMNKIYNVKPSLVSYSNGPPAEMEVSGRPLEGG